MGLGSAARLTLALVAASVSVVASAQVGPRPVALYPLSKPEGAVGDASEVQALLDVALRRAAQRNEDIAVAEPTVLRAACGPAPAASLSCLSGLAGPGLVLRSRVQRSAELLVVSIDAIDSGGRSFGPVSASVYDYVQNAEPLAQAILLLVRQVLAAGPPPPKEAPVADGAVPLPPPPAPKPEAPKPDLKVVTPPPLAAAVAAVSRPAAPPRAWMRTAGPWMTAAGAALLAGGVSVSLLSRSLSNDLDAKYHAGTLVPADLSSYDEVDQYNQLATILYASGGALTLSGVAIWTAAPGQGRAVAGLTGRF